MAGWRLARSLQQLRTEVDHRWPKRSKASDGTLGDQAHASRPSDHNPNVAGVVRALDITARGVDAAWLAERIRNLGAAGHQPLRNGGYIIHDHQIASETTGWRWKKYSGSNPHTTHLHISVGKQAGNYDSTLTWLTPTTHQPIRTGDDLMPALTDTEQRELLTLARNASAKANEAALLAASTDIRCARLEDSIHGSDPKSRNSSIWWALHYLRNALLEGDNGRRLHNLLAKHDT